VFCTMSPRIRRGLIELATKGDPLLIMRWFR
jgi:hypothetical protein